MATVLVRRFRQAGAAAWLILGAFMLFGPPRWRSSPSYTVIAYLLPLRVWAALFLAVGAAQVVDLASPRTWRRAMLVAGAAIAAAWAVSFVAGALIGQLTGAGGFALYGYLAATQAALAGAPLIDRHRLHRRARMAVRRARRISAE